MHLGIDCICELSGFPLIQEKNGSKCFTVLRGLREVVSLVDAFEPIYFCGDTSGAVKIADCWSNAGELIYTVDCINGAYMIVVQKFQCVIVLLLLRGRIKES